MAARRFGMALVAGLAALALVGCDGAPQDEVDEAVDEPVAQAPQPSARGLAATLRAAMGGGTQQVAIVDAQGFGQPMDAATLEIPAGWQVQGGVSWQRGDPCVGNHLRIAWTAAAPDGSEAFEVMHPFTWQVQGRSVQMNPCPVLPFASNRDFLMAVVQQRRTGARVLDYRDRADLAAQAEAQAPPLAQGMQRKIDAGELLVAYAAPGGEVQERFSTSVTFTAIQGTVMGGSGIVYAQRRLGGPPDAELGARIVASMKPNAQWLALMRDTGLRAEQQYSSNQRRQIDQWHAREMARINAQGAADRAAIRAQTQSELAAIQAQTYANTQATNDRMQRRSMEGIGEYNTYRDTGGNAVRSSIHGGSRVLQHGEGSYSSTNDPYLQPPGSVELKRVP
ncbi:MAG TPA: hypothetical protein PKO45_14220 [Rubrivivax sp.]|nr:hypothetical protein [Burkholderiales bacterium]HNT40268.1 hypothetical protein [Rubrivivax sp.]